MAGEAARIMMKFSGITGDVGLKGYEGYFTIQSVSLNGGWSDVAPVGKTGPRKAGTLRMNNLTVSRAVDLSTSAIGNAFSKKTVPGELKIVSVRGNGGADKVLTIDLEEGSIATYNRALYGSGGLETFSFTCKTLSLTTYRYDEKENQIANNPVIYDYEALKMI